MNIRLFNVITLATALALPITGLTAENTEAQGPHSMAGMQHDDHGHAHQALDHAQHEGHDHGGMLLAATITQTEEVAAAIMAGGEPIVVDVLGVVCDFCAMAMNKVFGKRGEVTAVHVDLDKKTLSLVIEKGETLSDKQIENLAKKAGYRIAAIRRNKEALGG
jgi:copper chaperone CopZ